MTQRVQSTSTNCTWPTMRAIQTALLEWRSAAALDSTLTSPGISAQANAFEVNQIAMSQDP